MKKTATNTFSNGLIMDLNPLSTPNTTLTGCLNGTMITYDGNEMILQNDKGNAKISNEAALPSGYVPVGMKEYGGIVYVASLNPQTGKGQIGSFPSPKQLYIDEGIDDESSEITMSNLINTYTDTDVSHLADTPYIENEYYQIPLFADVDGNQRKFYPGDKYLIAISSVVSDAIISAVNKGFISFRLAVVNSSGSIDYLDPNTIRLYTHKTADQSISVQLPFCYTTNLQTSLADKSSINVFNGKSSGNLIMCIELNTFDTFSIFKTYTETNGKISATLYGEITNLFGVTNKYTSNISTDPDNFTLEIISNTNTPKILEDSITINNDSVDGDTFTYKISPVCEYGVLRRMQKAGQINFLQLKAGISTVSEWRFFVADTYVKIGWGFDYYNIGSSQITEMGFEFIDLDKSNTIDGTTITTENITADYKYSIIKDNYNGSFEEIITYDRLSQGGISNRKIYVTRIYKIVNGTKSIVGYKLLYLGTFFNEYYDTIYDFTTLIGSNRKSDVITIKPTITATTSYNKSSYYLATPDSITKTNDVYTVNESLQNNLSVASYIKKVDTIDSIPTNPFWVTSKQNEYSLSANCQIDYDYTQSKYAGYPTPLTDSVFTNGTIEAITYDDSDISVNSTPSYDDLIVNTSDRTSLTNIVTSGSSLTGTIKTKRSMMSNNGATQTRSVTGSMLTPYYRSSISDTERSKLFGFYYNDSGDVVGIAADNEATCYNIPIQNRTSQAYGAVKLGGSGFNQHVAAANAMGGTINLYAGLNGDDASLRAGSVTINPEGIFQLGSFTRTTQAGDSWRLADNSYEIDSSSNFISACWKTTDNNWVLTNIMSPRAINLSLGETTTIDYNSNTEGDRIVRTDKMLNCFLSQICTVQWNTSSKYYTIPSANNYIYNNVYSSKINIQVSNINAWETGNTFTMFSSTGKTISDMIGKWNTVLTNVVDFTPNITCPSVDDITFNIEVGSDIDVSTDSTMLQCYISAISSIPTSNVSSTKYDWNKLYIGSVDTSLGRNVDGSWNMQYDSDGEVSPLVYTGTGYIRDWQYKKLTLPYEINSMFINSYKNEGYTSNPDETYYNSIYIMGGPNSSVYHTKWTKGSDTSGPIIYKGRYFGTNLKRMN